MRSRGLCVPQSARADARDGGKLFLEVVRELLKHADESVEEVRVLLAANIASCTLGTGDNPRQVLRDCLRTERETLEPMTNDITANV